MGGRIDDAPLIGFSHKHPELEVRDGTELAESDRQLVRYLFRGCRKVAVRSLDGGFSGNRVLATHSIDLIGLLGSALYLAGTILVTMRYNVPRNNALASLGATSSEALQFWGTYLSSWTAWNHVRTVAAFLATASFMVAIRLRP